MPEIKEYKVNKKSKNTRQPLSKEQLKNIARDCYRGDIFTSIQIQNPNDIATVFMPLMLMNPDQTQGMYQNKPHMYYAYMKDAFPRGVNGYPCFMSVAYLNKEETELFRKYYKQIEEAIDEI